MDAPSNDASAESSRADEEERLVRELLSQLVLISGKFRKDLEKDLGFGKTALSRILLGGVRLQFRHIVLICETLGVEPGDFFRLAFPKGKEPEGQIASQAGLGRVRALRNLLAEARRAD